MAVLAYSVAAAMVVTYIMLMLTVRNGDTPAFAYLAGLFVVVGGVLHAVGL